jgi:hypothetical protein
MHVKARWSMPEDELKAGWSVLAGEARGQPFSERRAA